MIDREKVLQALEHCDLCSDMPNCPGCAYLREPDCMEHLKRDIIALLKAQEPRVMTIGDLYGEDMGFYERKGEEPVWPVLIARGGPDDDGTVGIIRKDAFEIKADCGLLNQTWRIWTVYPTDAQREAIPWMT